MKNRFINDLILLLVPSLGLILHAVWSIYKGTIVIKGGTEFSYSDDTFQFLVFVIGEIILSIVIIYAYFKYLKDEEE